MKKRTILALVLLAVAVVGLLAYATVTRRELAELRRAQELSREEVFAGLVATTGRLHAHLEQLSVSSDSAMTEALLQRARRDAEEAALLADHAELREEDKRKLTGFFNAVGVYAQGETERPALRQALRELCTRLDAARGKAWDAAFLAEQEYPDFSSEVEEPRGLKHYTVTEQYALKVAEDFAQTLLSPAAHTDGARLAFYHFENANGTVRVSVTKQGGAVLYYKNEIQPTDGLSVQPTAQRRAQLAAIAAQYLAEKGYGKTVLGTSESYDGRMVLEMIPETRALLYPDALRVWVDVNSGTVVGLDAQNYLLHHHERDFSREILREEELRERLDDTLAVTKCTRAVIAAEGGGEWDCYAFFCERDAQKYCIFLDAATGAEREIRLLAQ